MAVPWPMRSRLAAALVVDVVVLAAKVAGSTVDRAGDGAVA